ncbi:50S ribosomal protein L4 [Candidatus Gracilibacteria bacterium]|nr:50S ribosomal protein L4 [Candidatus Gracilibacteria bacterium]
METKVLDKTGKEVGSITLNDKIFGLEVNEGLIHRALMLQLANKRLSLSHTKTRGEVRGSTRKIYRQKGTGRARAGSNRSPIRVGGGVAMGPRNNRNYTIAMNKKERQKALFFALSAKARDNQLVVVKDLNVSKISTKAMSSVFASLPVVKKSLVALASRNENTERSVSNLKDVKLIQAAYLNIADLLKYETLVLPEDTVTHLNSLAA